MKTASSLTGKNSPKLLIADKDDQAVSLDQYPSMKKVIYFYPKDDTPGCTIEAKEFSELLSKFKKLKTVVIGISGGSSKTKQKFCEKYKLAHVLASDSDFVTAKAWLSYGTKKFMGREYQGIFRNTFVLNEKNEIVKVFESVSAKGHAQEVLEFIKSLE